MLRQVEWGVENGPMAKNGILPATTLFSKISLQFKNLV